MKKETAYIECAGVSVPTDLTLPELRTLLQKRKIRFSHEKEILAVYGDALTIKAILEKQVSSLTAEVDFLRDQVSLFKKQLNCPGCGAQWLEKRAKENNRVKNGLPKTTTVK